MKHYFSGALMIAATLMVGGCSSSDSASTAAAPLHYALQAPDLIDVCRFDALEEATDPSTFNLPKAVGDAGEKLGDALDKDGRTRVLIKKKAAEGEKQSYTDNYLIQVATETGIKTVMARLEESYEAELFALDEAALYALPFRFIVVPEGASMVHVCMVDPAAYLSQFTAVSPAVNGKLQEAVTHFKTIIRAAFPDAYFDPQTAPNRLQSPENIEPIITLGQVPGALDTVSAALETGTLYCDDIAFKSGMDAFANSDGKDDCEDIFILYEDPATRHRIEIRGFVPFSTFKDFRKSSTFNIPNMTDTMAFLVRESLIHIFDGADRRQVYQVNGKTVYQLQIFDGHVDPMLISRGVSHFASVPMSVYLTETDGVVNVEMQNPVFKLLRYYADLTPAMLENMKTHWNNTVPPNKLLFPDYSLEEFGEFSLDIAQKVFDAAVHAIDD